MDQPPSQFTEPPWTEALLSKLGLQRGAPAAEVYDRADRLASRTAPNTRRLWRWILLMEGLAVLLPLFWLMVARRGWPAGVIASAVACCTLAVVVSCWWLRWRHQQHAWTRSRLLAEIARSALATARWPEHATRAALETAPSLQPLSDVMTNPAAEADPLALQAMKDAYLKDRIDDQLHFYQSKAAAAANERRWLSSYVTHALDGALILAVLGLWLGFSGTMKWLLSVANSDLMLGLAGAGLPLTAILMQSLSTYLEVNRRTGRYAQQWEFLHAVRARFVATQTFPEALAIVKEVERALLSEVTEWFYQAEHAEIFYRSAAAPVISARQEITAAPEGPWSRFVTRMMAAMGLALSFTGRVIFGRVLIVIVTSVLTALLIFSRAPQDAVQRSLLHTADGQLLSRAGPLGWWEPDPVAADRGFILIAHGLHDSAKEAVEKKEASAGAVTERPAEEKLHWMTALQKAIQTKLLNQGGAPDICLVDWSLAAKPSEMTELLQSVIAEDKRSEMGSTARFIADVAAIKSQAQAIGDTVGFKLAQAMKATPAAIHSDKPMHLIGHSAGGFLVVRAALVLQRLGLLPKNTRVTLLDTPVPDVDDLRNLLLDASGKPTSTIIDYYKSSDFAQGVPADNVQWPNYHCYQLTPDAKHASPMTAAHSYAHQWFIRSVTTAPDPKEGPGFGGSPFMASPGQ